jgi:Nif-specific regulatory protein
MLASFSEFKFYQSFRIPVEKADELRFLLEIEDENGESRYIDDAVLLDISVTGFGFSTHEKISVGKVLSASLQFKKQHIDLLGKVVRSFSNTLEDEVMIYGVELDEEKKLNRFLETYIKSFSPDRLKECLIDSALKERYTKSSEGFEVFSLLLSLFQDITQFGDKEGFIENMLEEVVRILNASRASIFLINPDSNELEAIASLGIDKELLKFDYRKGIAGSVFTTGTAVNIDISDESIYNNEFDDKFGFKTKSIICYPIHNREDKIIGVIEVLNKRNQDRFTVEDEKTMRVLSLVFSSVFHKFTPLSEKSKIRSFSTPFDREYALIGKNSEITKLRGSIVQTKDLDHPLLIEGEYGVGKTLFSKIIHYEGKRGLSPYDIVDCSRPVSEIEKDLFGEHSKLVSVKDGSLVLRQIEQLPMDIQARLIHTLTQGYIDGCMFSLDLRIMATTNKDLMYEVKEGRFNRELFDFINKSYIIIPPLRMRLDDIESLVDYFLKVECKKHGFLLKQIGSKSLKKLQNYDWPGNVQELQSCIERTVLYNPRSHIINNIDLTNGVLPLVDINSKKRSFGNSVHAMDYELPLKDRVALIEKEMILSEIRRHGGNKSKAAIAMNISREALRKKLLQAEKIENKIISKKAA